MENILLVFFFFIIYSFIGYITEIIFCSINSKKIIYNRGFLIGPYLPIYGTGALIIIYTLQKYNTDLLALFVMSMVYCTVLEYLTSLILEKIFHLRWWDYSEKKFNINGRVCLKNGVLFGFGSLLIVKVIHPAIESFVHFIPHFLLLIISSILLFIFLTDIVISLRIMFGLKTNLKKITSKDATEQIKREVLYYLKNYNVLTTRLLKSFPDLDKINDHRLDKFLETFKKVKNELNKIKLKRRQK